MNKCYSKEKESWNYYICKICTCIRNSPSAGLAAVPKGVGAALDIGGKPAAAFSAGFAATPKGVGAVFDMGGKPAEAEEGDTFSAGFAATPKGVGAAFDMGGKPAEAEDFSTPLGDNLVLVPGFGGKLKEANGLLPPLSFISLPAPALAERLPKLNPVTEDPVLAPSTVFPNPPKLNPGAFEVSILHASI